MARAAAGSSAPRTVRRPDRHRRWRTRTRRASGCRTWWQRAARSARPRPTIRSRARPPTSTRRSRWPGCPDRRPRRRPPTAHPPRPAAGRYRSPIGAPVASTVSPAASLSSPGVRSAAPDPPGSEPGGSTIRALSDPPSNRQHPRSSAVRMPAMGTVRGTSAQGLLLAHPSRGSSGWPSAVRRSVRGIGSRPLERVASRGGCGSCRRGAATEPFVTGGDRQAPASITGWGRLAPIDGSSCSRSTLGPGCWPLAKPRPGG